MIQSLDLKAKARILIGVLLFVNAAALYFVLQPPGGSALQLQGREGALRVEIAARETALRQLRGLAAKTGSASLQSEEFLSRYFLDRQFASSILVNEIMSTAANAGIAPREHSIVEEPIEGSNGLLTRTITGNYEGSYADLLEMVNAIDRSPRFLIIESLAAAPQNTGNLLFQIRYRAFVREVR